LNSPLTVARLRAIAASRPAIDSSLLARLIALTVMTVIIAGFAANQTWASARLASAARTVQTETQNLALPIVAALRPAPAPPPRRLKPGLDVDGDGRSDFRNPTGHAQRGHDAYGHGEYGASRDGGARMHEGVDYVSKAGQTVVAPMSGFVTRVGWAYSGDSTLRTVEINNPALNYVVRVLYVEPSVSVGDAVAIGDTIGKAQSLQDKYPGGMTNHVHLQVAPTGKDWMDASLVMPEVRG
jgi:peptidoglycan LD-endopeptidase LytH